MNIEQPGANLAPTIDLAHEPPFTLGPLLVEPAMRRVTCGTTEAMVEPKVMQVLVALGRQPGTILSRDDLIECCWDGRIVGDASVNRVMSLLRSTLRDLADESVAIETLPRVGYRVLVADASEQAAVLAEAPEATSAPARRPGAMVLVAVALAVLASLAWWWVVSRPSTEPLAVVMLPMEVSEGVDPIYASGMEAEIRSQLGRSVGMEVRIGESAAQLVAEGRSPAEIGVALNADLVWQGELDNSEDSVTLAARLIDSADGAAVWADNLTATPGSAQFLPMRATREMLAALGRPPNPEAEGMTVSGDDYVLYLTAMGLVRGRGDEQMVAAEQILEQVISRNPGFADGIAGLAKVNYMYPTSTQEGLAEHRARALELAERALALDPLSVDALKVSAMLMPNQREEQLSRLRQAVEIDPGDSEAWFWYAATQRVYAPFSGDMVESAARMVAIDPLWPASWRASDLAVEFGELDLARQIERDIMTASATRQQRVLAQARLARINGDLSEFIRLVRQVEAQLNPAEQRWGYVSQMHATRRLLSLPDLREPRDEQDRFLMRLQAGDLPSPDDFAELGVTTDTFFDYPQFASEAVSLFVPAGRGDELVAYYDARFSSASAMEAWAESSGEAVQIIPFLSSCLAMSLREAGRDAEAREHLALARKWIVMWDEAGITGRYSILDELRLVAIEGDNARAIELIRQLPDYGWPLQLSHVSNQPVGLLSGDPLYDDIRELPEVREVLDPIRAHIASERAEVLAQGLD